MAMLYGNSITLRFPDSLLDQCKIYSNNGESLSWFMPKADGYKNLFNLNLIKDSDERTLSEQYAMMRILSAE